LVLALDHKLTHRAPKLLLSWLDSLGIQVLPQLFQEVKPMNIEIRDPSLEARLKKQIETTESGSVEEVLELLLETKEQQDLWLQMNREAINADIRLGLEQLKRGEGIPDDQLDEHLAKLKNKS
jgi:hypothetical protein